MALAKIKKIQLISLKENKKNFLELLQEEGCLDVIARESDVKEALSAKDSEAERQVELDHANIAFAISSISPFAKKKGLFAQPPTMSIKEVEEKVEAFDRKTVINQCIGFEEKIVGTKNQLAALEIQQKNLANWANLNIKLENTKGTDTSTVFIGSVKPKDFQEAREELKKLSDLINIDVVHKDKLSTGIAIVVEKEYKKEVQQILSKHKFSEADLPEAQGKVKDYLEAGVKEIRVQEKTLKEAESGLKGLTKHLDNLKVTYDYLGWEIEKFSTGEKSQHTESSFIITAWATKEKIVKIEERLNEKTKNFSLTEAKLEEGEEPPVMLENGSFMQPFEAVSRIYGLPKHTEMDPTPFLAAYFIIFFALCLTDAGYGLLMFAIMASVLKFFKLPDGTRKMVKVLMYGGIVTFVIGAIFGGWFGLTPDQVPEMFTYLAADGERLFLFQKINALTNPITVLILALALGFIQILMGVIMKFAHDFRSNDKKEAILNTGPWISILSAIGLTILGSTILPPVFAVIGTYWVYVSIALLILTQGREKKSIIGKVISGVLSLYGLVGYMSDILSYSRLLALGLATAIIGLAVNIVADLASSLPYIGWLLMIIVLIGGHIFNLLINALGAFIHAGRLQFVEFFTKFMEGGGRDFKAFNKKTKYIFLKNNS
jgi:V/A-type H+/Na+-transporting ATPase subunit I